MPPLARPTRPRQPCRRVASTSCRTAEPAAKAPRPRTRTVPAPRVPRATATAMVIAPAHAGHSSRRASTSSDAFRQGSTGATAMRNSKPMPIGTVMRLKYGAPTESGTVVQRLRQQREHGAEQHDEGEPGEEHVVGEEGALARHRRVDRPGRPQPVTAPTDQAEGDRDDEHEERQQPRADVAVAEGVHRLEHAGSCEEGAEDRQAERGAEQRQVPHAEHPSALLHHHRVEVGGAGEPREQRGVLHGVPSPEAAPPEHLVAPPGAEDDPDGEEAPGEEGGPPGLDEPALAEPTRGQRRDGERERHREAHEAQVEHRRVEGHEDVLLQERVRPGPVVARPARRRA